MIKLWFGLLLATSVFAQCPVSLKVSGAAQYQGQFFRNVHIKVTNNTDKMVAGVKVYGNDIDGVGDERPMLRSFVLYHIKPNKDRSGNFRTDVTIRESFGGFRLWIDKVEFSDGSVWLNTERTVCK